MKYFKAKTC